MGTSIDWFATHPDPVLGIDDLIGRPRYRLRNIGRVTFDELRAIHAELFPPRCTCSLGRCTIHPADPAPEPPTMPGVADIAVRALLTAGP